MLSFVQEETQSAFEQTQKLNQDAEALAILLQLILEEKAEAARNFHVFDEELLKHLPQLYPSAELITTARLILAYIYGDEFLQCQWQDIIVAFSNTERLNEDLRAKVAQLSDIYLIDAIYQANPLHSFKSLQGNKVENNFLQVICSIESFEVKIFKKQCQLRKIANKLNV